MKRLKLEVFQKKSLNGQKNIQTQKVLHQVLGSGTRPRPRHCPVLAGVPGTIC